MESCSRVHFADLRLYQNQIKKIIEGVPLRNTLYIYINPKIASAEYNLQNIIFYTC